MTVDIEALSKKIVEAEEIRLESFCRIGNTTMRQIIDELWRLRYDVRRLNGDLELTRSVIDARERTVFIDGQRKGAGHERAAVIAWLRSPGTPCSNDVLADAIAHGEHHHGKKT